MMKKGVLIGATLILALLALYLYLNADSTDKVYDDESIEETSSFKYPTIGTYSTNQEFYQAYDYALQLFDIKLKEHDVETSYGNAHVIECGNIHGENLVLLHGMNATSTMWYPNIKELAKNYHIYAIDFGLEPGKSSISNEIKDMDIIVDWYESIFEQLSIDSMNLVGASRGGWLAVKIAINTNFHIKKLALLSPAQTFMWIPPSKDLLNNLSFTIQPKRNKLKNVLSSLSADVEQIDQTYIDLFYLSAKQAKINKTVFDMQPFSGEELHKLKMPVLLLIGDDDFINNENSLSKATTHISNLTKSTIQKAGHFLSIDQSDTINTKLIQFLSQNP